MELKDWQKRIHDLLREAEKDGVRFDIDHDIPGCGESVTLRRGSVLDRDFEELEVSLSE